MFAVFWIRNWSEVSPGEFSWHANFSNVFGTLKIPKLLRIIFVGTCSCIVMPGIRAKMVETEIPLNSVGDINSVVALFFIFGFKVTEVDCVWGWQVWFAFWAIIISMIFDGMECISSIS